MISCRIIQLIVGEDSWVTSVLSAGSDVWVQCAMVSQALCTVLLMTVCSDTMTVFQETAENSRKYKISCNNVEAVQMGLLERSEQNIPWDPNPNQMP